MKILFNGDSNMAGEELKDKSKSMAGVISQHFDAEQINLSLSGASNDRIYDSTLKYLEQNPDPDLIIIGWSEHGREQWFLNGQFHEVNNLGVGANLPDDLRKRYQFWKHHIQRDEHWFRVMSLYWHNKIFNLHTMLLEKKISHYFFNSFFAFPHTEKEQLDWKNHFFRPYHQNMCYVTWCLTQGFEEITPGWNHFDENAHKAWAEEILKVMCEDIEI